MDGNLFRNGTVPAAEFAHFYGRNSPLRTAPDLRRRRHCGTRFCRRPIVEFRAAAGDLPAARIAIVAMFVVARRFTLCLFARLRLRGAAFRLTFDDLLSGLVGGRDRRRSAGGRAAAALYGRPRKRPRVRSRRHRYTGTNIMWRGATLHNARRKQKVAREFRVRGGKPGATINGRALRLVRFVQNPSQRPCPNPTRSSAQVSAPSFHRSPQRTILRPQAVTCW